MTDKREDVARIIDPVAFEKDMPFCRNAALACADQVIALLSEQNVKKDMG